MHKQTERAAILLNAQQQSINVAKIVPRQASNLSAEIAPTQIHLSGERDTTHNAICHDC